LPSAKSILTNIGGSVNKNFHFFSKKIFPKKSAAYTRFLSGL